MCSRGSNIAASLRRCDADAEPQRHRHCQYKRRSKDAKCSFRRRFVSFLYVKKNSNIKSQQNNKMKHTTKAAAAAAAITHTLTRTHVCRIQRFFLQRHCCLLLRRHWTSTSTSTATLEESIKALTRFVLEFIKTKTVRVSRSLRESKVDKK